MHVDRHGKRLGAIIAASLLALGWAEQGLAADDPDPLAAVTAAPDVGTIDAHGTVDDALSELADTVAKETGIALDLAEPVVTVSQSEDGSVDVSVRVSSPEGGASPVQEEPQTGLISGATEADITSLPEPESGVDAAADPSATSSTNVNVSVRVLSPGTDGQATQSTTSGESWPSSSAPDTTAPLASESTPTNSDESDLGIENGEQYHRDDLQYQSSGTSNQEAWRWEWYLFADCTGIVASTSTETGSPSSAIWAWDWEWESSCPTSARPPPRGAEQPNEEDSQESESDDPADPEAVASGEPTSAPEPEAPWLFTWTFTFCGESVTMVLPIDVATSLRWSWEWTWSWTCSSADTNTRIDVQPVEAPPVPVHAVTGTPAEEGQAGGAPEAPGPSQVATALALPPLPVIELEVAISLPSILVLGLEEPPPTLVAAVDLETVAQAAPAAIEHEPSRRNEQTRLGEVGARGQYGEPHDSAPHVWISEPRESSRPSSSTSKASNAANRGVKRMTAARPVRSPLAPGLPAPFRGIKASGTSAGIAPGAGVAGIAALIGLLFLIAPGSMRRVLAARELSPRGAHTPSIDRPG